MHRALYEFVLHRVKSNIQNQKKILKSRVFRGGIYGTDVLKQIMAEGSV